MGKDDLARDFYDAQWAEKKSGFKYRYQVASQFIPSHSTVLDVGCGKGEFGKYLIETKNCEVFGVDISKEAIKDCKHTATISNIEKDGIPYGDKQFDVVTALELFEHLFEPKRILHKVMQRGKFAVISVPNVGFWFKRVKLLLGEFYFINGPPEHINFWTLADFVKFIEKEGDKVTDYKATPQTF